MTLRIVHLTDFHIDSPATDGENLRLANYKPFINNLTKAIKEKLGDKEVDYLVTTGDYINIGKEENFSHCRDALNHLASKLSLEPTQTLTCIGNHDYDRKEDKVDPDKARLGYNDFAKSFNQYEELHSESLFRILCDKKNESYFLVFDSTYGANGENIPSKLTNDQIDTTYLTVEKLVPVDKPLFVLSHYPMDQPGKPDLIIEETNWAEKHIWKTAYGLLFKLNALRDEALTVYFHGDGHSPDFWSYSDFQHVFMTGMIGGKHEPTYTDHSGEKIAYNKITELKVIDLDSSGSCTVNTLRYKNDGFAFSTNAGSWDLNVSGPRYKNMRSKNQAEKTPTTALPTGTEKEDKRKFKDVRTEVVSGSIEEAILDEISTHKLYSFAQHRTSDLYSSLGWVDIDSLMNNRSIFSRCVEKSRDWITKSLNLEISPENTILIGLDFWGSCIAAQTSVLTSISNYCVATKSKGRYNVQEEKLETLLKKGDGKWENVLLFSDVVSTGYSINHVSEIIRKSLDSGNVKIISVSVISDISQERSVQMDNFFKIATFCSKLRIPVLENDSLPPDEILAPRLDLS